MPEPPWDCWMVTASWPWACQCWLKAVLNSLYSSRVGSYDTLSRVVCACTAALRDRPAMAARAKRRMDMLLLLGRASWGTPEMRKW
ncbi:hypothetical protein D3C86_1863990 [compost metagenome]